MVYKISDTACVEALFNGWEETLIWSCLQGVMGEVYADDLENPKSTMAILGDFFFFAGIANIELVKYRPQSCQQNFIIMVPQNRQWAEKIESVYGENARKVERYAIKKEIDIFDRVYLNQIVENVPEGYCLEKIDESLFEQCKRVPWLRDLVSQFSTFAMYSKLGLGIVITKSGEILSGASSYSVYQQGIEIEIDTREDYRRKGLALLCGAKLILECLDKKLYPSWDAQNKASVALAEKLGYHFANAYAAYEILS